MKHRYDRTIPAPNARESEWREYLASRLRGNPRQEVRLSKRLRCDIVTNTHAWEVDVARKFREGVMQAIAYGREARLRPGLILLYDPTRHQHSVEQAKEEVSHFPETMRPVLLLCNILNGKVESASSQVDLEAILIQETSPDISGCLPGCGWLVLIGICCSCLGSLLSPDSPLVRPTPPVAPTAQQQQFAPDSLPGGHFPGESQVRPDSGPTGTSEPGEATGVRGSQADAADAALEPVAQATKSRHRVWKDSTGQYSVQAEYVSFKTGRVELRKLDGSVVSVPPDSLSTDDRLYLEVMFGLRFGVHVTGQVTAVSEKLPGMCEIRFPADLRIRVGDSVEIQRDGIAIGVFRVLAVRNRDVVAQNVTLRPRAGDTAIFQQSLSEEGAP